MPLQVSKDIENLAKAAEERRKLEEQGIGMAEAGLGLGAAGFAAQTGRTPAPAPAPKLSPFAQQVADADAARSTASGRGPAAMSQYTYNKPIGPTNPAAAMSQYTYNQPIGPSQYKGSFFDNPNAGRMVSSTQGNVPFGPQTLADADAARAAQAAEIKGRGTFQTTAGKFLEKGKTVASKTAGVLGRAASVVPTMPSLLVSPQTMGDATISGAIDRRLAELTAQGVDPVDAFVQAQNEFAPAEPLEGATRLSDINPFDIPAVETPAPELAEAPTMTPTAPEGVAAPTAAPEVSTAQQNFLARQQQGTPLTAQEISAAKRFATSQGQIFDAEKGYAPAEFYGQQYVGQSIGDYLRAVDEPTQKAEAARTAFERESEAMQQRIADRPDFMEAQPSQARQEGVMSMAQARKLTGGNRDAAKRMIELQKMGRDPLTGQPVGMTPYQEATLEQNQQRIDFAKEQAEEARRTALAKGATQAQKDAFELKQKELNYAMTYQNFLKDQESPAFDAKDIEADLEGIEDKLDIVYDPEAGVFRKSKTFGKGEVIRLDDPKNASIVRTIGTYKVGKALIDKYPKKG